MNKKILFALIFVLAFTEALYLYINTAVGNISVFSIICTLIFLTIVFSNLINNNVTLTKFDLKYSTIFIFWILYTWSSLLWAENPYKVQNGIYYLIFYLLFVYTIIMLINEYNNLDKIFNIIYIVLTLNVILGLVEIVTGLHLPISRYNEQDLLNMKNLSGENISTGTFYNENNYSLLLMILAPIYLSSILGTKKFYKAICLFLYSIVVLLVYLNGADAILLSLSLQVIIFTLFILNKRYRWLNNFLLFCIIGILIITSIYFILSGGLLIHSQFLFEEYSSNYIRMNLYISALEMLKVSQFLGVGIDNFEYGLTGNYFTGNIIDPHSWWFELLSENGIIISSLFFILFVYLIIQLYKGSRYMQYQKTYIFAFLSMTSLIIGSFGPSGMFYYWPLWFILGFSIALVRILKKGETK